MKTCALCKIHPRGEDSHIIPAFVLRYLKKTSPTGYLRSTGAPNRRLNDGPKPQLLCAACEDLFSVWEGKFAKDVWYPLHEGDLASRPLVYGDWLAKFAASITWRSLLFLREKGGERDAPFGQSGFVAAALTVWADFLNGKRADVGIHQLHMVFPSQAYELPGMIDEGFLRLYLYRAVDHTTIHAPDEAYILVKMARVLVIGTILPKSPSDWRRTEVSVGGGTYSPGDFQVAGCVWTLFESAYEKWTVSRAQMSTHQLDKIDAEIKKRFKKPNP